MSPLAAGIFHDDDYVGVLHTSTTTTKTHRDSIRDIQVYENQANVLLKLVEKAEEVEADGAAVQGLAEECSMFSDLRRQEFYEQCLRKELGCISNLYELDESCVSEDDDDDTTTIVSSLSTDEHDWIDDDSSLDDQKDEDERSHGSYSMGSSLGSYESLVQEMYDNLVDEILDEKYKQHRAKTSVEAHMDEESSIFYVAEYDDESDTVSVIVQDSIKAQEYYDAESSFQDDEEDEMSAVAISMEMEMEMEEEEEKSSPLVEEVDQEDIFYTPCTPCEEMEIEMEMEMKMLGDIEEGGLPGLVPSSRSSSTVSLSQFDDEDDDYRSCSSCDGLKKQQLETTQGMVHRISRVLFDNSAESKQRQNTRFVAAISMAATFVVMNFLTAGAY